eukprot:321588_1
MSLKQAVRFLNLSSQLNTEEKHSFLLKLVQDEPALLIESMFNHFKSESTDHALTVNINNTISSILISREDSKEVKPENASKALHKPTLDTMPPSLISKTASYLGQTEYAKLSQVCRQLFIGCHSPNSLQSIYFDAEGNNNHFPFNCALYSSVKSLHFDFSQYKYRLVQINHLSFLDQLEQITLSGNYTPDQFCIDDLEYYLPVCKNVQKLEMEYWSKPMHVSNSQFKAILSKFPNVQYLELNSVCDVEFSVVQSLFPGLKGLDVSRGLDDDVAKYHHLVHHFGDQLECLSLDGIELNARGVHFGKVQELRLRHINTTSINNIIKTATNVKNINLSLLSTAESGFLSNRHRDAVSNIFTSCSLLEYISIYDIDTETMLSLLRGVEMGLKQTKDRHRNDLKIRIEMRGYNPSPNPYTLYKSVAAIVKQITSSDIDNYMFIWVMQPKHAKQIAEKLGSGAMVTPDGWQSIPRQSCLVIQNDGCSITML